MKINDKILSLKDEFIALRKQIHAEPELGFDEQKTAKIVAEKLSSYGYEVFTGIGKTGVVARMKKGKGTKSLMLRADMDALPMDELSGLEYASKCAGKMHACGHDGHTCTLLLAAAYLKDVEFDGTLHLIFQPAEEMGAGAKAMIADGLFEKFPSDFIFGYHNMPNFNDKKGIFFCKSGGVMASIDIATIDIIGKGGHGSAPEFAKDPTIVAAQLLLALQTIISRKTNPQDAAVISCGGIVAGNEKSFNIIPNSCQMYLSTRTLKPEVRTMLLDEIKKMCDGMAKVFDVEIKCKFSLGSEVTFNDKEASEFALMCARETFGDEDVISDFASVMGSEDFGEFGKYTKAAYCFLANKNEHYLHHPKYVFDDDLLVLGASFFATLVKNYLK